TGSMYSATRGLDCPREPISKYFTLAGCALAGEPLKDHIVAALLVRSPIPGSVEGDEHAITVAGRKLLLVVKHHGVRRPMRRKCRNRRNLEFANPHLLPAIAAVFRRKHHFCSYGIVVALGPPIIAPLLQQHQLFCRLRSFFLRLIEIWPVRM